MDSEIRKLIIDNLLFVKDFLRSLLDGTSIKRHRLEKCILDMSELEKYLSVDIDNVDKLDDVNFIKELQKLINRHHKEKYSNTPDFILAQYLNCCLQAFNYGVSRRDEWYGFASHLKEKIINLDSDK